MQNFISVFENFGIASLSAMNQPSLKISEDLSGSYKPHVNKDIWCAIMNHRQQQKQKREKQKLIVTFLKIYRKEI